MAKSNPSLQKIQQLLLVSNRIKHFADNEEWDDFLREFSSYELVVQNLSVIDWASFSKSEQTLVVNQLLEIQNLHQQIIPLAERWQNELKGLLQNEIKSRKLDAKYR